MLSSIARFVLNPFHILLFLALGAVVTHFIKQKRIFRVFLASSILWFLIITTPFVPYILVHSLESRYLPLVEHELELLRKESEVDIIVLGSGYVYNENLPANSQLDKEMLSRLAEGVRLVHQLENSTLVVSGPYNHDIYSQADVAKNAAMGMGVQDDIILTQSDGTTTAEEAQVYYKNHYHGEKLVVVTAASHMHRALSEFRRLGINAVPSPSAYRFRSENGMRISFWPSLSHVDNMRAGMFEYAALFRNCVRDGVNEYIN